MTRQFVFHEVTPDRWTDLERLFESPGGPKHCWCMVWRSMPQGVRRTDRGAKKAVLESTVQKGAPVGILAYVDKEPVAWCSIAPRVTYRGLGGKINPSDVGGDVWSLVCFFVLRKYRIGATRKLIAAAVEYARRKGATVVEAYPVDPDSPSYRFMGFVSSFEALGFREVGRAGTRRHVMRLTL